MFSGPFYFAPDLQAGCVRRWPDIECYFGEVLVGVEGNCFCSTLATARGGAKPDNKDSGSRAKQQPDDKCNPVRLHLRSFRHRGYAAHGITLDTF